jgi:hypothetical protein
MTVTPDDAAVQRLGDAISAATESDLRRTTRRPVRRVALALAVLVVLGTGTVAAAGLLSPRQVAAGMPAGAAIFDQTDPACTLDADGRVFHCVLTTAPVSDQVVPVPASSTKPVPAAQPDATDYSGWKEVLAVDGHVAGGCIGQDVAGMHWDCYLGQDAVTMQIVSGDFLGQPVSGPGRG